MSVSTSAGEAVQTVFDILDGSSWSLQDPEVQFYWDVPQSQKGPGADQPPEAYVFSPTGSNIDKFSADGDLTDETQTVLIQFYVLKSDNRSNLSGYLRETIDILGDYYDDNTLNTNFTELAPQSASDFRRQANARKSDYHIGAVEVEGRKLEKV